MHASIVNEYTLLRRKERESSDSLSQEATGFHAVKQKAAGFYAVRRKAAGFTLVELILVVTIIGILSAILISTINTQMQRRRAADAVSRAALEQASQGLESYFAAEGTYPAALNGTPNIAVPRVREYLTAWPTGFTYVVNGALSQFAVYVLEANNNYLKYDSSWGKIQVCTPIQITVLGFCTVAGN